jgi:hypothetical protein
MPKSQIKYKIPITKQFAQQREARKPINTYTSFWDAPNKLGKKKKVKIKEITVKEEEIVEVRKEQPNGRWNNAPARTKPVKIKFKGKKKVPGIRVKVYIKDLGPKTEESEENYKKRLNLNFTNKRHYGRFTKNPRGIGRDMMPVSNELTRDEFFNDVYYRNDKPKLK